MQIELGMAAAAVPVTIVFGDVATKLTAPYTPEGVIIAAEQLLPALTTLCLDEEFRHLLHRIVVR